jgi:hypothetical protein
LTVVIEDSLRYSLGAEALAKKAAGGRKNVRSHFSHRTNID